MAKSHSGQRRASKRRQQRKRGRTGRSGASAAANRSARAADDGSYDPSCPPVAARWLALGQSERLEAVRRYHLGLAPERQPPSMDVHASLHVLVESQLASNEPPEALIAAQRLMAGGLSRHDAVHAVGWVAAEHMKRAMEQQRPVDVPGYAAALAGLTRDSWIASAGLASAPSKPLSARRRSD